MLDFMNQALVCKLSSIFMKQLMLVGQRSYLHLYLHIRSDRKNFKITMHIKKANEAKVLELSPSSDCSYRSNSILRNLERNANCLMRELESP